jgi:spore coat polysaccharide biosynthesis protein SpsF (cytidylyltransferase family)
MSEKFVGLLVARQSSSRLPGKALASICGKPMIGHILDRMEQAKSLDQVAVATSTNAADNAIAEYCKSRGTPCFRGHPEDVLDRIFHAAKTFNADAVVEIGGDCPLVHSELIDHGVQMMKKTSADLVSNSLVPPFTYPVGYDFIGIKRGALQWAHENAKLQTERFLPFQFLVKHAKEIKIEVLTSPEYLNHMRWTLDYPEDLDFVKQVYEKLLPQNPNFGFLDILKCLRSHPELSKINEMHASPVSEQAAWFTGSYVQDAHLDLQRLLEKAEQADRAEKNLEAQEAYREALDLLANLLSRQQALSRKRSPHV